MAGKAGFGCADARPLIAREGLEPADRAALASHVAACAECRAEEAAFARLDATLGDAFAAHPFDAAFARDIARAAQTAPRVTDLAAARAKAPSRVALRGAVLALAAAAAALLAMLSSPGESPLAPAPGEVARAIARVEGHGLMRHDEGGDRKVAPGDSIRTRERVVNNGPQPVTLVLEDGTRIALRPDTSVTLHVERDEGVTVAILGAPGEVYCEVEKRKTPFRVAGGGVTAAVLGTRFSVAVRPGTAQVVVAEGLVRVSRGPREECLVAANQLTRYEGQGLRPAAADPVRELVWHPRYAAEAAEAARAQDAARQSGAAPPPARPAAPVKPTPVDPSLDQPVDGGKKK